MIVYVCPRCRAESPPDVAAQARYRCARCGSVSLSARRVRAVVELGATAALSPELPPFIDPAAQTNLKDASAVTLPTEAYSEEPAPEVTPRASEPGVWTTSSRTPPAELAREPEPDLALDPALVVEPEPVHVDPASASAAAEAWVAWRRRGARESAPFAEEQALPAEPAAPDPPVAGGARPAGRPGPGIPPSLAVAIRPPRVNEIDVAAMEQLAGTLNQLAGTLAFELVGTRDRRQLVVRGEPSAVEAVVDQLFHVYRQIETQPLTDLSDPVRVLETLPARHEVLLSPAAPAFVSLRTWKEFEGGDPLNPLLASMAGLADDEVVVSQVVVVGPAPERWAEPHLQQLNVYKRRLAGQTAAPSFKNLALGILAGAAFLGGFALLIAAYWMAQPWMYGAGGALVLVGGWLSSLTRNEWAMTLDAEAEQKLREQAFQVELRVTAGARTETRARAIASRVAAAYQLFNTTSGNHLLTVPGKPGLPPRLLAPRAPQRLAILSVKELSGLWHMPVGQAPDAMPRAMFDRLLPVADQVADRGGMYLGVSRKGPYSVPVWLSAEALRRNLLLLGKTQYGKSNAMEHLAAHWMSDPKRSVVLVDPHGDLAVRLIGLVPPERVADVIYIDLTDTTRSVGLNLFDVSSGRSPDEITESFVDLGQSLWENYWGPRMFPPLSNGSRALAFANLSRAAERQYTIFSLMPLLMCADDTRLDFLHTEVPGAQRPDLFRYFTTYFENTSPSMKDQVISPVISKALAFERSAAIKRLVGQPHSTLDLHAALRSAKILIVNANVGVLGDDLAGFMSALLVNAVRRVVMAQAELPRAERVKVSLLIDEAQKVKGVNFPALLGEPQKYGGNLAFGTQALDNLRIGNEEEGGRLGGTIAGASTLMVFQCNGDDARYLCERDIDPDQIQTQSLTHLPRHHCYVKTILDDGEVPPLFSVEIAPPLTPDPEIAAQVRAGMARYTTPADQADRMANDSLMRFEEEYERPRGTGPLAAPVTAAAPPPLATPQGVAGRVKDAAGAIRSSEGRRKAQWQAGEGAARHDGARRAAASQEPARPDAAHHDTAHDNAAHHNAAQQEAARHDAASAEARKAEVFGSLQVKR